MPKCIKPMILKDQTQPLPCGRCSNCRENRVYGWAFRLSQEAKVSTSALFVTLTYENPPITKNGFMTVDKSDLQKFFKRLRKLNNAKLKYYAAAEYGENKQRPHYHICLFNADKETLQKAWSLGNREIGSIHVGEINEASTQYALKYIAKKSIIPVHPRDDRQKEFALISKGLGAAYLTDNIRKFHLSDIEGRAYINTFDAFKLPMPRYYKSKIYTDEQLDRIQKSQRKLSEKQWSEMSQFQQDKQIKKDRIAVEKERQKQKTNLNNQKI